MALILTIAQAKQYVRISNVNSEASMPSMDRAGRRFLKPILGPLYDTLDAAVLAGDPAEYDATLLERCRAALVPLAYWSELGMHAAALTDAGVRQQQSESMPAAFRWQYKELEENLHDQGAEAIDALWQYLYDNATDLGWTEPLQHKTVFSNGAEFALFYPIDQPARVYASLRPLIGTVLESYVYEYIGQDLVEELFADKPTTGITGRAFDLLRKAVANLSIKEAVSKLPCKLGANGFTSMMGFTNESPRSEEKDAPDTRLRMVYDAAESAGQLFLKNLKTYLDAHATEAGLETYAESDYYIAPADADTTDPNENRTGVYGL